MCDKKHIVSVIITTYNRAHLVARALESVISQTYTDFELIVVDDASTDNTGEVIGRFADERIRYVRHDRNKGGPAARNTGIRMARGKYMAFLDDDDEWFPRKLEKEVECFKSSSRKTGLVYSGSEGVDGDSNSVCATYMPELRGDVSRRLLYGGMVTINALVKKECFDKVGLFDESLASCQDWDMWKRVSDLYEFDFVPDILVRVHSHSSQISADFSKTIPGRTRMIEKHMDEFKKYPDVLVIHLKRMGKLHCINGTWKEAFYWFKKAVEVNAFEIVKIVAWCITELPRIKFFSKAKNFKKYSKL